jgi:hypothetical protein
MGTVVSIDFSRHGVVDPTAVAVMSKAYEMGCVAIRGRPEGDKERLAHIIVGLAMAGERDVVKLSAKAVNAVTSPN